MSKKNHTDNLSFRDYDVVEPVPINHRHYSFVDMTSTWIVANANPTSWYVGSTLGALGIFGAIYTTVFGNVLTYIILALVGYMGYKVGISSMGLARVPFGIKGSKVPSFFNATQFVGWCGVNTFLAAIPLSYMLHSYFGLTKYGTEGSELTMLISVLIIMIPTMLIAVIGGSKIIKIAQKICNVLLISLSIWIFIKIFQNFTWASIAAWTPAENIRISYGVGIDALAALGFAWIMAVADYSRYTKTKKSATVAPMIGATVGMIWFCLIGSISAIAVAILTNNFDPALADPGSVTSMLGMGHIASVMIVISIIAVNLINVFSGGYSTLNVSSKLKPRVSMVIISVLSTLLAIVPIFIGSLLDTFSMFLDYLGAVFPPCIAIMVVDYFILRKRKYYIDQLSAKGGIYWYSNGINWLAGLAWALGAAIFVLSRNIDFVKNTIGSVFLCFVLTGLVYFIFNKLFNRST